METDKITINETGATFRIIRVTPRMRVLFEKKRLQPNMSKARFEKALKEIYENE